MRIKPPPIIGCHAPTCGRELSCRGLGIELTICKRLTLLSRVSSIARAAARDSFSISDGLPCYWVNRQDQ